MEEYVISVIVPIYNVEPYLKRCVDSIRQQSYSNLEIILVDDGSKDRCGIICDEYEQLDDRIKVIHKVNGGLSDARNAGLDIATGDFILFVDSDDFIHRRMCERLSKKLLDANADVAICNIKYTFEGKEAESDVNGKIIESEGILLDRMDAQYMYFDKQHSVISTVAWNKLYKKSAFNRIRYPKGKIHEDEFTTYKILYHSDKIIYLDEQLYFYFQKSDSIMAQFNEKRFHLFEAYRQRMQFYIDNQEYELFKKMSILYMRMSAQYMKWSMDKQSNHQPLIKSNAHKLADIYTKNKKMISSSISEKLEYRLFFFSEKLYFTIWNVINGKYQYFNQNSKIS